MTAIHRISTGYTDMAALQDTSTFAGPVQEPPATRRVRAARWLLGVAIFAIALTALAARQEGNPQFSVGHVTFWWIASMVIVVCASSMRAPVGSERHVGTIAWPMPGSIFAWTLMTLVASIPRFVMLDRFPSYLDADEAAFMMHGVEFRSGAMSNPFSTGFTSHPLLFPVAQAQVADVFGGGVAAHRALSAAIGTIGVLAAWRLGTRLFGNVAGTLGALLLATLPIHVHLSRMAMDNVTDPTVLTLALLYLLRAMERRRPHEAVFAGLALGCGLYGYYGGRALPIVVLTVAMALGIHRRTGARAVLSTLWWLVLGFSAVATPLLVAMSKKPAEFAGHLDLVSSITVTSLRERPLDVIPDYLRNLADALVYPVAGNSLGFFRVDPPFIGWPMTVLMALGMAALLVRTLRQRELGPIIVLLAPYAMLIAGIALAVPIQSQRYTVVTPLLGITAGLGLCSAVRVGWRLWPSAGRWLPAVLACAVILGVGVRNLAWLASEDRQIDTYGDYRTIMMWDIGWRLHEASDFGDSGAPAVLLMGEPYVFSRGFPNLTFLAPGVEQRNVHGMFATGFAEQPLTPGNILVIVPERAGERCAVEDAYPSATVGEAYARDGTLLYLVVYLDPPAGWSTAESPAGSTLKLGPDSPCATSSGSLAGPNANSGHGIDRDRCALRIIEFDQPAGEATGVPASSA